MNFTVTTDSSVTLQALAALTLGGTSQSYNNTYFLGPGTSTWSFSSTELSITSTLVPATYEVSLGETLTSINGPAYSGSPFPPIIKSVTVLPFNNMVPEIDPGSMASALTLLIGGVLTLPAGNAGNHSPWHLTEPGNRSLQYHVPDRRDSDGALDLR